MTCICLMSFLPLATVQGRENMKALLVFPYVFIVEKLYIYIITMNFYHVINQYYYRCFDIQDKTLCSYVGIDILEA